MSSRARLVAGEDTPQGQLIGVHVELADNWKTYWRNPGDAGIPPLFDWKQSRNVASVKVLYPAPRRFGDPAGETIGYKHEVVFPVMVTRERPGEPAEVKLRFDYAVCAELCVPAQADLTLLLGPGTSSDIPSDLVSSFLARVPQPASTTMLPRLERLAKDGSGRQGRLTVDVMYAADAVDTDLFVEGPANWFLPLPRETSRAIDGAMQRVSYEISLADLPPTAQPDGQELTLTIVSGGAAVEQTAVIP
mgnify:FL=1